jgi:RNA polymerase I-specific transcription initiation factor RRN5
MENTDVELTDEEDFHTVVEPRIEDQDSESSYKHSSESAEENHRDQEESDKEEICWTRSRSHDRGSLLRGFSTQKEEQAFSSDDEHSLYEEEPVRRRLFPQSPSKSRSVSNKRKAREPAILEIKEKRFKGFYNDEYRRLLNAEIDDYNSLSVQTEYEVLPSSQIGASIWTSDEKEIFFGGLQQLGKDNIRGIATRIGTKSPFQVQEYLQLLDKALLSRSSTDVRPLPLEDIPVAFEISDELSSVLSRAAESLADRQDRYERDVESAKWGDQWLLTSSVNSWIERQLENDHAERPINVPPVVEFFNLKNWLDISSRVFMNPSGKCRRDLNWQNVIEDGEEHGIRATAFEDFHTLTISITKRLISATLFCAMSRLRGMDTKGSARQDIVRQEDVIAAIETLNLPLNSHEFWKTCPRRCHLEIYENITDSKPLDYKKVEKELSKVSRTRSRSRSCPHSRSPSRSRHSSPSADESTSETSLPESLILAYSSPGSRQPSSRSRHSSSSASSVPSSLNPVRDLDAEHHDPSDSELTSSRPSKRAQGKKDAEQSERAQIRYVEAFDHQASLVEEQRLWKLMGIEPPFEIKPEAVELPNALKIRREKRDGDWRDMMEFWSAWETVGCPEEREFGRNRRRGRKRRRVEEEMDDEDDDDEEEEEEDEDAENAGADMHRHRRRKPVAAQTEEEARDVDDGLEEDDDRGHEDINDSEDDAPPKIYQSQPLQVDAEGTSERSRSDEEMKDIHSNSDNGQGIPPMAYVSGDSINSCLNEDQAENHELSYLPDLPSGTSQPPSAQSSNSKAASIHQNISHHEPSPTPEITKNPLAAEDEPPQRSERPRRRAKKEHAPERFDTHDALYDEFEIDQFAEEDPEPEHDEPSVESLSPQNHRQQDVERDEDKDEGDK